MNNIILTELGKNTEVTGVASGTKVRNGVNTGEPCIVVYVPKKKSLAELTVKERIPARIDGKLVDIQEAVFKALSLLPSPVRPKAVWEDGGSRLVSYRPAVGGISVGHYAITAGTLGVAAYAPAGRVMLSNNHVLANCNDCAVGDNIYQPGPYDGGTVADKLGELLDWIPVVPEGGGATNQVDAAIALPTLPTELDLSIADLTDMVLYSKAATVGMDVTKSGRTTQVTSEHVAAVDGAVRVQYPTFIAAFVNQIMINSSQFLSGGDSGSACLEVSGVEEPTTIVGLCFAGSMFQAIVCPIAPALSGLHLTFSVLVDLHGVVKRNGTPVSGASILVFNYSTFELIEYIEADSNGAFGIHDTLYQYETAIIFAQYTIGSTEYGGFKRIHCNQSDNYAVVNLSEYTPVPDGLFCRFKLNPGDFLNGDISVEEYFSNLF